MDPKKLTTLFQHSKDTSPTIEGIDSDMEQRDDYEQFHDLHDAEEEEYELDESPPDGQFPQTQSTQAQSTQAQSTQVQSTQAPSTQQASPAQPQPTQHQDAHTASNDLTRLNDDIGNLPSDTDFDDILRSFDATFAPKEEGNKSAKNDQKDSVFPPDSQSQSQSPMPGTRAPPTSRPSSSSLPVGEIAAQVRFEDPIIPNLQQQQQILAHGVGRYAAASHAAMEAKHKELTKGRKRRSPEPEDESEEDTDDDFDPLGEVPTLDIEKTFVAPWAEMEAEAAKRVEEFSKAIISHACQIAHDVSAAFYTEFNKAKEELQKGAAAVKDEEKKQAVAVEKFQDYLKIMEAAREKMQSML